MLLNFVFIRKVRFAGWIWNAQAPTGRRLALRNMTYTESRNLFELRRLRQKLRPVMLADLTHELPTLKNVYYRPKTANRQHTAWTTASCSTPARDTSSSSVSAWEVPHCQLSLRDFSKLNFKLQSKNADKFWHVSAKRIGPISNPGTCTTGIHLDDDPTSPFIYLKAST